MESIVRASQEYDMLYLGQMPRWIAPFDITWALKHIYHEKDAMLRHQFISNYHLFKWWIREEFELFIALRTEKFEINAPNAPQCCLELFVNPVDMIATCSPIAIIDNSRSFISLTMRSGATIWYSSANYPTFKNYHEDHSHAGWTEYIYK